MKKRYYLLFFFVLLVASPVRSSLDRPINLMEDPSFKDFVLFLNPDPEKSITDKREESFSINEDGLLHVSGKGWGYLRTNSIYGDYLLVLEYKWGEQPRRGFGADSGRAGGLLLRAFGEDALYVGSWPSAIIMKLHEPSETKRVVHTGDFIVLANTDDEGNKAPTQFTSKVKVDPDGQVYLDPDGKIATFPSEDRPGIRVNGLREENYVEHPAGEWNRVEVVCVETRFG